MNAVGGARVAVATDHDDRQVCRTAVGANALDQLEAIHRGQVEVRYQSRNSAACRCQQFERLPRGRGDMDLDVGNAKQCKLERRGTRLRILDDQDGTEAGTLWWHDPSILPDTRGRRCRPLLKKC